MESKPPASEKPKAKAKAKEEKNTAFVLKPKKGTSAWIYFNTETVAKLKQEKGLEQKQAFAKSAEMWKALSDDDKKPYNDKATADEKRYKDQLAELEEKGYFTMPDGTKSTDQYVDPKKKYGEDCVVPKKPLSAYLFFTTENVNKIKEKDGCSHPEAMKKCGEVWNGLSADEKKIYEDKNAKDTERYKKQLEDLDKNGYFMMDDGTKSSDHKSSLKKKRAKKSDKEDKKVEKPAKKAKTAETDE